MSQDAGAGSVDGDDVTIVDEALDPVGAISYDRDAEPEKPDDTDDDQTAR
jgi:hypothetical protein